MVGLVEGSQQILLLSNQRRGYFWVIAQFVYFPDMLMVFGGVSVTYWPLEAMRTTFQVRWITLIRWERRSWHILRTVKWKRAAMFLWLGILVGFHWKLELRFKSGYYLKMRGRWRLKFPWSCLSILLIKLTNSDVVVCFVVLLLYWADRVLLTE